MRSVRPMLASAEPSTSLACPGIGLPTASEISSAEAIAPHPVGNVPTTRAGADVAALDDGVKVGMGTTRGVRFSVPQPAKPAISTTADAQRVHALALTRCRP